MFTLLKVPKLYAIHNILHLRSDGTIIKKLLSDDADLIYKADDGEMYLFFIINANYGDTVRYSCFEHSLISLAGFNEIDIYECSCEISEMCKQILKQGHCLSNSIENLLRDKLPMFFDGIIQYNQFGFNSCDVWENYEWILRHLGKRASDYVSQEKIDIFINMLSSKHEIEQIEKISESDLISIGVECIDYYIKAKDEIENTIEIVRKHIFNYCNSPDFAPKTHIMNITIKNTPCGKVKVHIKSDIVIITMDNGNYSETVLNISERCDELRHYFN